MSQEVGKLLVNWLFHLLINGVSVNNPLILTFDPNFPGHPSTLPKFNSQWNWKNDDWKRSLSFSDPVIFLVGELWNFRGVFFSNLYVRNLLTLKLFFVNIEVGIVFDGNSIGILLHAVRIPSKKARTPLRFQSKGPQTKTQVVLRTRVGLFLFWFTHYSSVRCTYIIYINIYIFTK